MTADKNLEKIAAEHNLGKSRNPFQDAVREFRRNKIAVSGLIFVLFVILVAVAAPIFAPYGYETQNLRNNRAKPMEGYDILQSYAEENCHWYDTPVEWGCTVYIAGSDALGRDLWSRIIYGTRVSLSVAVIAATVSLVIGLIYGTVSGYSGGRVDVPGEHILPRPARRRSIHPQPGRSGSIRRGLCLPHHAAERGGRAGALHRRAPHRHHANLRVHPDPDHVHHPGRCSRGGIHLDAVCFRIPGQPHA